MTRPYNRRQDRPSIPQTVVPPEPKVTIVPPESEEQVLEQVNPPEVPEVILPELKLQPQAYRVLKEKMVIIYGSTTYVAVGKIVRDPGILAKLIEQKVELEPYIE